MKIATWNVNSIRARLPNVLDWLVKAAPDVVLLQELKTIDQNFPAMEIQELGYNCAIHGQKSYNGVAILSKHPLSDVSTGLAGDKDDNQARYVEAFIEAGDESVRVASIYLPNGNPIDTDKYLYKLEWMDRLGKHAADLLRSEEPVVLGGDYNVIPADGDCYDVAVWANDALFQPEIRAKFRSILNLGYSDAWRDLHTETHVYSFWDYQRGAWQKNNGIRIDHLLLSPQAADRLARCEIDIGPRGRAKASDHTPVWCELTT
ncbi:MAG: exodeoxyribonuclease III [Alphaproteobacteria bacterium]|nr:exodeoxyribonuclease III [Alphaproteobacteria bacterium]HCP01110.1 exodeoxyribonuclease III [Rhodospirillaceae bacterium]